MRRKRDLQLLIFNLMSRNKTARELEAIAHLLDANRDILDLVYRDLAKYRRKDTGRNGHSLPRIGR